MMQETFRQSLHRGDATICHIVIGYDEMIAAEAGPNQWALRIESEMDGGSDTELVIPLPGPREAQVLAETLTLVTNLAREQGYHESATQDRFSNLTEVLTAVQHIQTQAALILSGAEAVVAAERRKREKRKKRKP